MGGGWIASGSDEYARRISAYFRLTLTQIPEHKLPGKPSPAQIEKALAIEGKGIWAALPSKAAGIALCPEGKQLSSNGFAQLFEHLALEGRPPAFIIGSSHGLCPEVKAAAYLRLSFSMLTFPHKLARLILLEQIYRAGSILGGGRYHK